MANRDRLYECDADLFIAAPRTPQVIAGALMASLALLWTAPLAPSLQVAAPSAGWAVALTVAIIAVALMLVAAVGLVAADWWAELKSRKAYAAIGFAVDGLLAPPVVQASDQGDHLYPPAASNEGLWAVLLANRHAARSITLRSIPDTWNTDVEVGRKNALRPKSAPLVGLIPEVERTNTVGGSGVAETASGRVARVAKHDGREALRVRASIGLTAIQSQPRQRKGMGVNRSVARWTRLVANGPWSGSPGSDRRSVQHRVPVRIISDIIIFGQGKRPPPGGEPPPCALPGGSIPGTGVSIKTAGASTTPDQRQHPRAAPKSLQPEIFFEAQRKLMALAQALARQAAREDDATERLTERSRSPPDIAVEIGRGGSGRENTS